MELLHQVRRPMGMQTAKHWLANERVSVELRRGHKQLGVVVRVRVLTVLVVLSVLVILGLPGFAATEAQAHINPNPASVKAGAKVTVSFSVGHGCGASPITKLQMKIPIGVKASDPSGPETMVPTVSGDVVTFVGAMAGKDRKIFLTLQFPKTPGVLSFPVVQTCKVGKESWIEVPNSANPKPRFPAPRITVK